MVSVSLTLFCMALDNSLPAYKKMSLVPKISSHPIVPVSEDRWKDSARGESFVFKGT